MKEDVFERVDKAFELTKESASKSLHKVGEDLSVVVARQHEGYVDFPTMLQGLIERVYAKLSQVEIDFIEQLESQLNQQAFDTSKALFDQYTRIHGCITSGGSETGRLVARIVANELKKARSGIVAEATPLKQAGEAMDAADTGSTLASTPAGQKDEHVWRDSHKALIKAISASPVAKELFADAMEEAEPRM